MKPSKFLKMPTFVDNAGAPRYYSPYEEEEEQDEKAAVQQAPSTTPLWRSDDSTMNKYLQFVNALPAEQQNAFKTGLALDTINGQYLRPSTPSLLNYRYDWSKQQLLDTIGVVERNRNLGLYNTEQVVFNPDTAHLAEDSYLQKLQEDNAQKIKDLEEEDVYTKYFQYATEGQYQPEAERYTGLDQYDTAIAKGQVLAGEMERRQEYADYNALSAELRASPAFEQDSVYKPITGESYADYRNSMGFWGQIKDSFDASNDTAVLFDYIMNPAYAAEYEAVNNYSGHASGSPYMQRGLNLLDDGEKAEAAAAMAQGEETFTRWLSSFEATGELTKRRAALDKAFQENLALHPITALPTWAAARAANLATALIAPIQGIAMMAGVSDPNHPMFATNHLVRNTNSVFASAAGDLLPWQIPFTDQRVGEFLFNGATAITDFAIARGIGGLAGGAKASTALTQAIMSSQAASNTFLDAMENDMDPAEAIVRGLLSAAIEAFTEKYSIEALLSDPSSILPYIGKNILTEGTEEGLAKIFNTAGDGFISALTGKKSALATEYANLRAQDVDQKQAQLQVLGNFLSRLTGDVLLGGFTGGVLGAGTGAQTESARSRTGHTIAEAGNIDQLVDIAVSMGHDTNSYGIGTGIKQSTENGKKVTDRMVGRLYEALVQELDTESATVITDTMRDAVAQRLIQLGDPASIAHTVADGVLAVVRHEKPSRKQRHDMAQSEHSTQVIKEIMFASDEQYQVAATEGKREAVANQLAKNAEWAKSAIEKAGTAQANIAKMIGDVQATTVDHRASAETVKSDQEKAEKKLDKEATNAKNLAVKVEDAKAEIQRITQTIGGAVLAIKTDDGTVKEVKSSEATFLSRPVAQIVSYVDDMSQRMSQGMANMLLQTYTGGDVKTHIDDFQKAYAAGFDSKEVGGMKGMDDKLAQQVAEQGRKDAEEAEQQRQATIGAIATGRKGSVTFTEDMADTGSERALKAVSGRLSDIQKKSVAAIKQVARATGVNFVFFESQADDTGRYTAENGHYDVKTGTIYLDLNSGKNSTTDLAEYAILRTAGHELTHFIEHSSKEGYAALRDFVTTELIRRGENFDELVARKMDNAARTGSPLTRAGAISEVVADASELMLRDTKAIERLAQKDQGLMAKIKGFIQSFLQKVRDAFSGVDAVHDEARVMMQELAEEFQQKWDFALEEAVETAQKGVMEDAELREAVQDVKFSPRSVEDPNKTTIKQQIISVADQLNVMDVVANVTAQDISKWPDKKKKAWVLDILKTSGYKIDVKDFGSVEVGKNQIETSLTYLDEPGELAAFACIPRVIKRGMRIAGHENHKGRQYATVTFAAPVAINGVRGNMAVVVKKLERNLYKTHRILMPDGSAFEFVDNKKTESGLLNGIPSQGKAQAQDTNSVNTSISQNSAVDNREFAETQKSPHSDALTIASQIEFTDGERQSSLRDSAYHAAVETGNMNAAQSMVDEAAEQQFAGSKIRDKNGKLLKVYHGTNAEFNVFDTGKRGGVNGISEGYGIYLSDSQEVTSAYGQRQIAAYANITRPATNWKKTIKAPQLAKLIEASCKKEAERLVADGEYQTVKEALRDTWISNYVDTYSNANMSAIYRSVANSILNMNDNDMAVIQEVMAGMGIRSYAEAEMFYDEVLTPTTGIDGFWTTWENRNTGGESNIILALKSNQVKYADPVTYDDNGKVIPLSERFNKDNEDIRYSLRDMPADLTREYMANLTADDAINDVEKNAIRVYTREVRFLRQAQEKLEQVIAERDAQPKDKQAMYTERVNDLRRMITKHYDQLTKLEATKGVAPLMERSRAFVQEYVQGKTEAQVEKLILSTEREVERLNNLVKAGNNDLVKERNRRVQELKQLRSKATEKLLAEQERYRNMIATDREIRTMTQKASKLQSQIAAKVKALDHLRRHETDYKNVPEAFKPAVDTLVSMFADNFGSMVFTGDRAKALSDVYAKLRTEDGSTDLSAYKPYYVPDVEELLKELAELAEKDAQMRTTSGKGMTRKDMAQLRLVMNEDIKQVVDHIAKIVTDAQNLFYGGRKAQFDAIGTQIGNELNAHADAKTLRGKAGNALITLDNLIRTGNMTPVYFFKHLGNKVLGTLWNDIRHGQNEFGLSLNDSKEFIEEMQKKYHYWDWANKKNDLLEITTEKGRKLTFTREQALWLYATWKRETNNEVAATEHLTKGGIIYEGNTQEGKGLVTTVRSTPAVLSDGDIQRVVGWLTDAQKAYADGMVAYLSEDMADRGNRASMAMFGIRKYTEKYYFPYKVAGSQLYQTSDAGKTSTTDDSRLKHSSFTNRLTKKASAPLVVGDFSIIVADHIARMTTYSSFVLPIESMNRVLNYKVEMEDGSRATVRSLIEQKYGEPAKRYIATLLADLNGGIRSDNRASGADYLIRMYKKGAVSASLSTALQQPTSIFRAMAMISPKYITAATFSKRDWDELMKYSGVAVIKDMGRFDTDMGRSTVDWLNSKKLTSFMEKADFISSWLPGKMDQMTWAHLWNAVKREQAAKNPNMNQQSEDFLTLCAERFNDIVDHTQVYDSILSRSQLMRGKDAMSKMVTSFKAEPTLTLNMLYDAAVNISKPGGKAYAAKVFAATTVSSIAAAAMAALVQAWNDDDDKRTATTKYMDKFIDNAVDNLNILTMIPIISDAWSVFSGYDVQRADMSLIVDLKYAIDRMNSTTATPQKKLEGLIGTTAKFFGLSIGNAMRDGRRFYNLLTSRHEAPTGYELSTVWPWADDKLTAHYSALYSAMDAGNSSLEKDIREYLAQVKGKTGENVDEEVRGVLKERVLDGSKSDSEARAWLKTHMSYDNRKAFETVDRWQETADHEGEGGWTYSIYNNFYEAVESGKNLKQEIKQLLDLGIEAKTLASNITTEFKPLLLDLLASGKTSQAAALQAKILDAYVALGYDREKKLKDVKKWYEK